MKRLDLKKHGYIILWAVLLVLIIIVWSMGGAQRSETVPSSGTENERPAVSPSPLPSASQNSPEPSAPSSSPVPAEDTLTLPMAEEEEKELIGVWIPYFSLQPEENSKEAFELNFKKIADEAKEKGINALFVHVRPFSDALYPSELYPWSHILTGEQGKDPGFDPLEFMAEYAHELEMELHAWINPLRVMTSSTPPALHPDNPYAFLREDHPYYFMEYEGGVYLDPAYSYVRSLIADGAAEIVKNYEVDGIHFDDYFYPTQDPSIDEEGYELYISSIDNGEPLPLLEWRKANINAMVEEVYRKVKAADEDVSFGISPQGNISNDENMGADVKTWCSVKGYVDYICPQLYYSFDNPALGYEEALEQWLELDAHEELKMYIGLALYKAGTSDADSGTWEGEDDIIARQIQKAREAECEGIVLYASDYLDVQQTREEMANAAAEIKTG